MANERMGYGYKELDASLLQYVVAAVTKQQATFGLSPSKEKRLHSALCLPGVKCAVSSLVYCLALKP